MRLNLRRNISIFHWLRVVLLLSMALTWLPSSLLLPPAAYAQTRTDPEHEIVYLDNNGVIKVLVSDTQQGCEAKLDWVSPIGGFRDFALGDVNNDGDMEIVALRGDASSGTLTVYDPVVASGSFDALSPNRIPWAKLYEITIPGEPKVVATGRLADLPGDHIVYTHKIQETGNPNVQRLIVLIPTTTTPTGRTWQEHFRRDFDESWERISTGNADGDSANIDEIGLVDDTKTRLAVYPSNRDASALFRFSGETNKWRTGVFAQYDKGGREEFPSVRSATPPLFSFVVFKHRGTGLDPEEIDPTAYNPAPRFIFRADINNDDADEVVMLRSVDTSTSAIRMIVRAKAQSSVPKELEQPLDADNGYQSGAGGDVDNDGRDEIVIMRDNNIRIYTQPEKNASFNNFALQTNSRSIAIGNLDTNCYRVGEEITSNVTAVEDTLTTGTFGQSKVFEVRNKNASSGVPISFNVAVDNNVSWLGINPTFGNTPALVSYQFNAVNLAAGDYSTNIRITSSNPNVINQPYLISVKLKVTAKLITLAPASLQFTYSANNPPTSLSQNLSLLQSEGVRFTASVAPQPAVAAAKAALSGEIQMAYLAEDGRVLVRDAMGNEATLLNSVSEGSAAITWLSVSPESGTIPSNISVTVTPGLQTQDVDSALVVIIGDSSTGKPPENVRLVPVSVLRATTQVFLPVIRSPAPQ